jgi:hypothetical protein
MMPPKAHNNSITKSKDEMTDKNSKVYFLKSSVTSKSNQTTEE